MNREINESVENITEFTILEHPRSKLYSNFPARGETTFERKTKAWNPVWQRCAIDRNKARTSLDGREPKTESHSTHPPARNFHPFTNISIPMETFSKREPIYKNLIFQLKHIWTGAGPTYIHIYIYTLARW